MPHGGNLLICLHNRLANYGWPSGLSPGKYVVVSISDTGTGMDEATLTRAFEPFFTRKEIGSGSGRGLPMVQAFAAQSGGDVRIQSKVGEGTTVELSLPRLTSRRLKPPIRRKRQRRKARTPERSGKKKTRALQTAKRYRWCAVMNRYRYCKLVVGRLSCDGLFLSRSMRW
jgi:hypothetical protein